MAETTSLGQRIRLKRNRLNLTQHELAEAVGTTSQHISAIEQDKWAPSLTILIKLAEVLGVTTDFLLCGKESLVTDIIPAIKADNILSLKVKKALIVLVEEQRASAMNKKG